MSWFLCCPKCGELLLLETRSLLRQEKTCQVDPAKNMQITSTFAKTSEFVKEQMDRLYCPSCGFEIPDVYQYTPAQLAQQYPKMIRNPDELEPLCYYYKDIQTMGGKIDGIN